MRARGEVTVAELTSMFGVSRDTVRRDLYLLERRGLLNRTHGGALPVEELVGQVMRFQLRVNARTTAKQRIARAAASLIQNGESLILNGGSTTCAFAAELGHLRDLTLVTNNMMLPACIPPQVARSVYVLGGEYWDSAQITVGSLKFGTAKPISVDTAIVSFTGINVKGLSIGRLEEAVITSEMMDIARRIIVVADHSKFGVEAFAHVAAFDRIQSLVTDAPPPADIAAMMDDSGIEVVIAPA